MIACLLHFPCCTIVKTSKFRLFNTQFTNRFFEILIIFIGEISSWNKRFIITKVLLYSFPVFVSFSFCNDILQHLFFLINIFFLAVFLKCFTDHPSAIRKFFFFYIDNKLLLLG